MCFGKIGERTIRYETRRVTKFKYAVGVLYVLVCREGIQVRNTRVEVYSMKIRRRQCQRSTATRTCPVKANSSSFSRLSFFSGQSKASAAAYQHVRLATLDHVHVQPTMFPFVEPVVAIWPEMVQVGHTNHPGRTEYV